MHSLVNRTHALGAVAIGILGLSCTPILTDLSNSRESQMAFRVENATASAVDVVVEVLDSDGNLIDTSIEAIDIPVVTITTDNVSYSTLTPIGAAAAQLQQDETMGDSEYDWSAAKASVRVPGFAISEGILSCGAIVKVTASVDDDESPVLFSGEGTGTPGFDAGSVGAEGERFLVIGEDITCGQNVVIRIGADSSTGTTGVSSTATGMLAVVDEGESSPFDPIDTPGSGTGQSDTTITVKVDNQASIIADLSMVISASAGDQTYSTSVPPDEVTEGAFSCGTQLTFSATFPNTDRPPDQQPSDEYPDATILLTGDGTGALGFDESSISADGERILVFGTHVDCGDTVSVTILDDSAVMTPNGFNGVATGSGVVQVGSNGTVPQPGDEGDPDMTIVVYNETSQFMRVNVVAGTANLGQQLDIYVPDDGSSEGALSCADRYTVTAYSLAAAALEGLQDQVLIVLTGDGTGTAGFDEGSVGAIGQRVLVRDVHYECGNAFEITITDPGAVGYPEPDLLNTNGDKIGYDDINGNGIQDSIPDQLGSGEIEVVDID